MPEPILDFDKALMDAAKAAGWLLPGAMSEGLRDRFIDSVGFRHNLEQMAQQAVTRARREALEEVETEMERRVNVGPLERYLQVSAWVRARLAGEGT